MPAGGVCGGRVTPPPHTTNIFLSLFVNIFVFLFLKGDFLDFIIFMFADISFKDEVTTILSVFPTWCAALPSEHEGTTCACVLEMVENACADFFYIYFVLYCVCRV